jgi:hypothetical protein
MYAGAVTATPEIAGDRPRAPVIDLAVTAYPPWARLAAAALTATRAASLPAIGVLVLVSADPPILPPVLFRLVATFTAVPAAAGLLLRWLCRARARVDRTAGELALTRPGLRVTVPLASVARIVPWRVPLPAPGLALDLRSGRRLGWSLALEDPQALLDMMTAGGLEPAGAAAAGAPVAYARARARIARRRWYHLAAKFPLFALVPAAVLVTTHQWIAWGGPVGQYHLEGLGPYLRTFIVYWASVGIYLGAFASALRGLAEACCLGLAWARPRHAIAARRTAEVLCRLAYYGGVPALLLARYMA